MKKKERECVESLFLGKKRCINTVQVDKELYNLVLSDLLSDGHCFSDTIRGARTHTPHPRHHSLDGLPGTGTKEEKSIRNIHHSPITRNELHNLLGVSHARLLSKASAKLTKVAEGLLNGDQRLDGGRVNAKAKQKRSPESHVRQTRGVPQTWPTHD